MSRWRRSSTTRRSSTSAYWRFEDLTGIATDLVVLDTASLRLVHRVLGSALVLYGADEPERVLYEATVRRMTTDFARHADALDREMLRAIAAGRR